MICLLDRSMRQLW